MPKIPDPIDVTRAKRALIMTMHRLKARDHQYSEENMIKFTCTCKKSDGFD